MATDDGSYGDDIYTEPPSGDDTLAQLGPLAPMAGVWAGAGHDEHPVAEGTDEDEFNERYELQPIDPQTNGPQLLFGLRYHTHVVRPDDPETFHDQVGYWLWEPARSRVMLTLSIPRAQVVLAGGPADAGSTEFELRATRGDTVFGILSNPFLDSEFTTVSYRIHVTIHPDGRWSYEEEGVMQIAGRDEPFSHIDRNTLTRIAPPSLNPRAVAAGVRHPGDDGSLGIGSLR
ncbi:MAG: heme-binding beta-barrel domain-containing protein [Ilumatobacteraceae bacterium]